MVLVKEKLKRPTKNTVFLRPLNHGDRELVCRWMSDPYVVEHSFVVPGPSSIPFDFYTESYAHRYVDLLLSDPARRTFAIIYNSNHVGNVGFKDINIYQEKAECFIEIGDRNLRGRGIGQQAMALLLRFGVDELGLKTVELEVLEFNVSAIKIYQKLGFQTLASYTWHYDEFGIYWRVLKMRLEIENT